jgi:hypothetical protein
VIENSGPATSNSDAGKKRRHSSAGAASAGGAKKRKKKKNNVGEQEEVEVDGELVDLIGHDKVDVDIYTVHEEAQMPIYVSA